MSQPRLTLRQLVVRSLFMLAAIAVICWFIPRNEAFRYEYEVGKPWRYGRLSAPYDFAIYISDSAMVQMEDSLRRQIVPRFTFNSATGEEVLRQLHASHPNIPNEAYVNLRKRMGKYYSLGVIQADDLDEVRRHRTDYIIAEWGDSALRIPTSQLLTELGMYEALRQDSLYGSLYARVGLQRMLRSNLELDTMAMRIEYSRLRQQVSATIGVVLADSRIIDQGEIVTPRTFDILESYRHEQQQRMLLSRNEALHLLGRGLFVALALCSVLLFLKLYRPWLYLEQKEVFLAIGSMMVMLVFTSLASHALVGSVYLVPIGIVTIVLSTFLGSRTAFFCHIILVLLCSFVAPSHFEYIVVQICIGVIIIFCLKDGLQERAQLMHVCIFSAIGYVGTYALYTLATEGSLTNVSLPIIGMMLVNAILMLLSYLIIYAMEKAFGVMSGVTLNELCNLSSGLLLRLQQEARGTFDHSLQVANLADAAAKAIHANASLCRTAGYYHDIGKLWNPQMYTENQQGGPNPHDKLSCEESVEVIRRHVTEGLRLARKENLPDELIKFIECHHGRSLIKYFYVTWCNAHPDETVNEADFSYPGPDPVTREQCIIMMADSIEAASHSLSEMSHEGFVRLVNNLVNNMVSSGRFDNAKISLLEISQCKDSFVLSLESINHVRIAYPELKK